MSVMGGSYTDALEVDKNIVNRYLEFYDIEQMLEEMRKTDATA